MRAFKICAVLWCGFIAFACNKEVTTPGSSVATATYTPTMNATITGTGSNYNFNCVVNNNNGYYVLQGTSSDYTLTLNLRLSGPGQFTMGDATTNYYATITDNFGDTFQTNNSQTSGDLIVNYGSSSATYNGTFTFTAVETSPDPGKVSLSVNGTFTNL
jgi:hypothetical protein